MDELMTIQSQGRRYLQKEVYEMLWPNKERRKDYADFLKDTYLAWGGGYDHQKGYVYLISCGSLYKIGKTRNLKARMSQISTANPNEIEVVAKNLVERPTDLESMLHDVFSDVRVKGEWFELSPEMVEVAVETIKICP